MEENNPQQNFSQLCKMGCGYFGSSNFDGLCSQCYKEKEKQFENNHTLNNTAFPTYNEKPFGDVQESLIQEDLETESVISSAKTSLATSSSTSSFSSIVTGDTNKSDLSNSETNSVTSSVSSVKKNRCQLCRKKVGLTGFACRCGGMFCSAHRYSDSHSCTYDYKIEAENAIRKANPRIVSNKVSKI